MVLVCDRSAEQSHESIAGKLRRGPPVAMHLGERSIDKPADQLVHRLRSEAFGDDCRINHVAEQHGYLLQLTGGGVTGCDGLAICRAGEESPALAAEPVFRGVGSSA